LNPKRLVESPREVRRKLLIDGWTERGGKGDHRNFSKPGNVNNIALDMGKRQIPIGTLREIYRRAGWIW
jgi:predicted RNA binding protein YcfA (HicA-like mRNA interferase family)